MPYVLATSPQQVENFLEEENPYLLMGMDTEATSLNTKRAKLVGISLSLKAGDAIYIPIGHRVGDNLQLDEVWPLILKKLETHKPIFYNAKYDLNIIQLATGYSIPQFGDALELVYLHDPDRKRKGLKEIARSELGFEMEKFEDLFSAAELKSGNLNIANKSPTRCTNYACADADAGLRVWEKYQHVEKDYPNAVAVDHQLIDIVRKMEHNGGLELNLGYIKEQIERLGARAEALKEQIFRAAGYHFEMNSPKQLGIALFERMGIPSPGMTAGPRPIHSTREEVLEKLATAYPIVELVICYRKVEKARGSYFTKLKTLAERQLRPRFSFNMFSAPTFRFAAPGGDPDLDGFTGINIQAVSNGETRDVMGVRLTSTKVEDDYLSQVSEDELLVAATTPAALNKEWTGNTKDLPYVIETEEDDTVCFRETCAGCPAACAAHGIDVTRRLQKGVKMIPSVRQAFRAPEGWTLVSFDYRRQELVIGANMSGEPKWIRALKNGVDLHAQTAADTAGLTLEQFNQLPGPEKKRKREIAKMMNFATFYGATAYTLVLKANLTKATAEQVYDNFVKNHPTLFSWIAKVHAFSRREGYTTTYFGRKRSLKWLYDDPSPKMQAFANRSAVNTAIQGTGAEITRIAMVKVAKALAKAGYNNQKVKFVMQLHDELSFLVKDELLESAIPVIKEAMEFKVKKWEVQLTTSYKTGTVWGLQKEHGEGGEMSLTI